MKTTGLKYRIETPSKYDVGVYWYRPFIATFSPELGFGDSLFAGAERLGYLRTEYDRDMVFQFMPVTRRLPLTIGPVPEVGVRRIRVQDWGLEELDQ